jgi:alkanesulfonate monooxygenase SsuD/methylene tetrahydromethanopterin reductase-like flavin-dependent oxidoreductase (luciferase family)
VIAGTPATVRDEIASFVREFGIGNLLVMLQMGGMPHGLALKNIHPFAEEVLPHLREVWADEGWENKWWPTGQAQPVEA